MGVDPPVRVEVVNRRPGCLLTFALIGAACWIATQFPIGVVLLVGAVLCIVPVLVMDRRARGCTQCGQPVNRLLGEWCGLCRERIGGLR